MFIWTNIAATAVREGCTGGRSGPADPGAARQAKRTWTLKWRPSARHCAALGLALAGIAALGLPGDPARAADDFVLDEDGGEAADLEQARATLARTLPPGASRDDEIRLLVAKDKAARTAGLGGERLAILRRLVELTQGTPAVQRYWSFLWREEWRSGNQAKALQIGQELLSSDIPADAGTRIAVAAQLADDYLEVNQRSAALRTLDDAKRMLADYVAHNTQGVDRLTAIVAVNEGMVLVADGRYGEAETVLKGGEEHIEKAVEASRNLHQGPETLSTYQSNLSYERAIFGQHVRVLAQSGRYVEAEVIAREGLKRSIAEGVHGAPLGEWYVRIAQSQIARRQYDEARASALEALDAFRKGGLAPSSSSIINAEEVELEGLLGARRWADAAALYAQLLADTADDETARRTVANPLLEALLQAKTGNGAAAAQTMERVARFRARIYGESNPRTVEARAVYAVALQSAGSTASALDVYHGVFKVLFGDETRYVDTVARGLRGFYLPMALESYLELVAAQAQAGRLDDDVIADAFVVTDRLRDSRVQAAMIDSAARALVDGNAPLAAALREDQDASVALRTAYENQIQLDVTLGEARKELARLREDKKDTAAARDKLKALEAQADELKHGSADLEARQAAARARLARDFPAYHRLVNPKPARPSELASDLRDDEAFLGIYSSATSTFLFVVRHGGAARLVVTPVSAAAIASDVALVRDSVSVEGRSAPPPFEFAAAARLEAELIEPVAASLHGAARVSIAASGALGALPFALLVRGPGPYAGYDSAPWLVRDYALSYVPSAAALARMRAGAGRARASEPFAGFGAPRFPAGVGLVALPETKDEILAMARALGADPASSTYFDTAASREQVLSAPLDRKRVVAFATHGLRPGELPDLSEPALALAASGASASLLTLDDVLRLHLGADLVVLSACNTASSDGLSAEAISGLGRGFFFAGARAVLLTHWEVESISAQQLVTDMFQRSHGDLAASAAEALQGAQLQLIGGPAAYRHPFFWAAYALAGDTAGP